MLLRISQKESKWSQMRLKLYKKLIVQMSLSFFFFKYKFLDWSIQLLQLIISIFFMSSAMEVIFNYLLIPKKSYQNNKPIYIFDKLLQDTKQFMIQNLFTEISKQIIFLFTIMWLKLLILVLLNVLRKLTIKLQWQSVEHPFTWLRNYYQKLKSIQISVISGHLEYYIIICSTGHSRG